MVRGTEEAQRDLHTGAAFPCIFRYSEPVDLCEYGRGRASVVFASISTLAARIFHGLQQVDISIPVSRQRTCPVVRDNLDPPGDVLNLRQHPPFPRV